MENSVDLSLAGYELSSTVLKRKVKIDFYASARAVYAKKVHLLMVNDGQDLQSMDFKAILEHTEAKTELLPLVVIAVHCGDDRINEYGIIQQADFKGRGNKAAVYEQFLLNELLPFVYGKYNAEEIIDISIAGFSLGGLTAFDLAWQHPEIFSRVGVFSGSLWWRSKDHLEKGYNPSTDRIIHNIVRHSARREGMKFFFECGELDEMEDRNRNGVIDTIDDTIDLMRELLHKGYLEGKDMYYLQLKDGRHDVATWAKAWPVFLRWSFEADSNMEK